MFVIYITNYDKQKPTERAELTTESEIAEGASSEGS